MHKYFIITILCLFVVAAAPWLVSSCSPRPLLPPQLEEERAQYQTRAAAAQQATLEEQRAATSAPPKVIAIGTINPVATLAITPTLETPMAPLTATTSVSPSVAITTATTMIPTEPSANSTVRILSRATVTQTGTPISTVVIVHATPPAASSVLSATTALTLTSTPIPVAPISSVNAQAMSAVEDIITDAMLREQVQKSNTDGSFSDLTVRITSEGLRVTGKAVVTLFQQPFTMTGTFVVENESLAVRVESILLNGVDVTAQYRSQLEDEIRWQLYQLLPQRFVQSFTLADGQIVVQSLKR